MHWVPVSLHTIDYSDTFPGMELFLAVVLFVGLGVNIVGGTDFHSITVKDLQGNDVPMSVFKGKVSGFFVTKALRDRT